MIPRYSRPEMVSIWSSETRFAIWFEIEAHATTKLAELGVVPKESAQNIWDVMNARKAETGDYGFDVARIDEIERTTKHDVIAFLTHLSEIVGPDATVTLDFALARLTGVIDKLGVYPENMRRNLDLLGGLHNSQRMLLALTQAGYSREDSYAAVQRNAMKVWEMRGDRTGQFAQNLKDDPQVTLNDAQIDAMFDDAYHLKHVDTIFKRVFGEA